MMKVTGLALVPPPSAADLPKVTPELLASVLARYSRSTEGIGAILSKVDIANPDASIDRILKFVDYGHASIGGLTGGLAVALDGVSMWMAYKIFEIAQMADGQESSTRYITMDPTNLPDPSELGIPEDLAPRWRDVMARAFAAYNAEYARLDALSIAEPGRVRLPKDAKPAVVSRMRRTMHWTAPAISSRLRRGPMWGWSRLRECGRSPSSSSTPFPTRRPVPPRRSSEMSF